MPHIRPPPPIPPIPPRLIRPASATVLAAEPQVRDLKKELTALVPAAISRKTKQKERERVLSSVPDVPKMVVNAAPEIEPDTDADLSKNNNSSNGNAVTLLGSFKPHSGIQFITSGKAESHAQCAQKQNEEKVTLAADKPAADSGSLDDEYQKFLKQMNGFL
ncbi:hypothetical protein J3B02_005460 [Coemansia erecta]|nr:hypothetical protein J3B02_005460 [Coemansia erecta]